MSNFNLPRKLRFSQRAEPSQTDKQLVKVIGPCQVLGHEYFVLIKLDDLISWQLGQLAQNAFPYLTKEDREFLISGTSPEGWLKLFSGDDEFDNDDFDPAHPRYYA